MGFLPVAPHLYLQAGVSAACRFTLNQNTMKLRMGILGVTLTLLLGGSAALTRSARGQEAAAESVKRKVKNKVVPEYPPLAKQMNVTGRVKIETTISAEGRVTTTKVVGGSPLLVNSAMDALKKWRFEPAAKETSEIIEFDFH
jgi:TonB family protein